MAQRILVVEDDPNIRQVLKLQLEGAGYDVGAVEDGLKAIEEVSRLVPELILLDVMMPKMDGYEVCRRLKAKFETSRIPVIMLTAKSTPIEKVEGFESGANDYVTKPYAVKELLARVKAVLHWSKLQREANPLTGLPGNFSIENEANARINSGAPFAFAVCDIDSFKAFNDFYGYHRGDDALKMTAAILLKAVEEKGTGKDFVGQIGGDDFVYITSPHNAELIGEQVTAEFDQRVQFLYNSEDRRKGYLEVRNRRGEIERFPIISITIAVVKSDRYVIEHVAKLSDIASELKTYGKSLPGSVVVSERRTEQQKAPASKTGT
ncbi:MAG: response regulator [Candidatus Eisenbacteria bacterium]|nr:response regulator [Candidatus Eisenbacteria bacterium]